MVEKPHGGAGPLFFLTARGVARRMGGDSV